MVKKKEKAEEKPEITANDIEKEMETLKAQTKTKIELSEAAAEVLVTLRNIMIEADSEAVAAWCSATPEQLAKCEGLAVELNAKGIF